MSRCAGYGENVITECSDHHHSRTHSLTHHGKYCWRLHCCSLHCSWCSGRQTRPEPHTGTPPTPHHTPSRSHCSHTLHTGHMTGQVISCMWRRTCTGTSVPRSPKVARDTGLAAIAFSVVHTLLADRRSISTHAVAIALTGCGGIASHDRHMTSRDRLTRTLGELPLLLKPRRLNLCHAGALVPWSPEPPQPALAQPCVGGVIAPPTLAQLLTGAAVGPVLAEGLVAVAVPPAETLPKVVRYIVETAGDTAGEGGAPEARTHRRTTAATLLGNT